MNDLHRKMLDAPGHKVKVTFLDGTFPITGKCIGYTQALDNEPEIASIDVRSDGMLYELYENDIKDIEILNKKSNH